MKYFILAILICFAACSRHDQPLSKDHISINESSGPVHDDFNLSESEYKKAASFSRPENIRGGKKPIKFPPTTEPIPPPTPTYPSAVVLLDFDGHYVSGTKWAYYEPIAATASGQTETEQISITDSVREKFTRFNIRITTDENEFLSAPSGVRIIITEYYQWFGYSGGTSFVNVFDKITPAFVFSSLHGYSTKKVSEAIAHEIGHTLGLRHHELFGAYCTWQGPYKPGVIMGNNLNSYGGWWTETECFYQCDECVIVAKVGFR